MLHQRFILLAISLVLVLRGNSSHAQSETIWYEVSNYGAKHAVVILTGTALDTLTANLSTDGLSVRVSSTGTEFRPGEKQSYGSLITEVQHVRRGSSSDLVVNLALPCELSVTPSGNNVKLFLKGKRNSTSPQNKTEPEAASSTPRTQKPIPLTFLRSGPASAPRLTDGIQVILPAADGLQPQLGLAAELKRLSYALELTWSWVSGQSLAYEGQTVTPARQDEVDELERLVRDLTQELIEVRKSCHNGTKG